MFKQNLLRGILAGVAISLGGVIYLSCESSLTGATLFSIGLLMIYLFDWNLYTGKACYFVGGPPTQLALIANAFLGNFIGTFCTAQLLKLTKLTKLEYKAQYVVEAKLESNLLGAFILGIGCGILMYVAVIGYKTVSDSFGKYLVLIMPIVVFTVSGFEHVVADMFYFSMAGLSYVFGNLVFLVFVALGNLVGCSVVPFCAKFLPEQDHH